METFNGITHHGNIAIESRIMETREMESSRFARLHTSTRRRGSPPSRAFAIRARAMTHLASPLSSSPMPFKRAFASSTASARARFERRAPALGSRRARARNALATPDVAFAVSNAVVMPIYAAMIAFPRSRNVKALIEAKTTFWVLAACYGAAAFASLASADVFAAVQEAIRTPGQGAIAKSVTLLCGFLATPQTAASAWVHLVSLDLFVARFVYLDGAGDGKRAPVPVRHSLVLCCMFGPIGLMSHAVTSAVWNAFVTRDVA